MTRLTIAFAAAGLGLAAVTGLLAFAPAGCACALPGPAAAAPDADADPIAAALAGTYMVRRSAADGEAPVGAAFRDRATGLVVTAAHVIGDAAEVLLQAADGRLTGGRVIARDAVKDLAVLEIAAAGGEGLPIVAEPPRVGAVVYAVGAPLGLGHTVSRGIVSALGREIDARTPYGAVQHDAALNPGSSGGPLVDDHGRVVGLNIAMPDGFRRHVGVGYAAPAGVVAAFLQAAQAGTPLGARPLGIRVRALDGDIARALGLDGVAGVLVEDVRPGEAGFAAGIRPGDVVRAAADRPVRRARDLTIALDAAPLAAPVAVSVRRDDRDLALILPPGTADRGAGSEGGPPRRPESVAVTPDPDALGIAFAAAPLATLAEPPAGSRAAAAGLAAGDTIVAVDAGAVADAGAAQARISVRRAGPFALLVRGRDGGTRYVVIDPTRPPVDGLGERGNIRARDAVQF